jgi:hypothetical protein
VARIVCQWTNRLPEDQRDLADDKLVVAALAGVSLQDLAELYGEIYEHRRADASLDGTGKLPPDCRQSSWLDVDARRQTDAMPYASQAPAAMASRSAVPAARNGLISLI